MLLSDCMTCDECGRVFPLFNNDLILQPNKHSWGWHSICKDCLQKRNSSKIKYSATTNFNLEDYIKEYNKVKNNE